MDKDIFWNYLELPTPVILSSPLTCDNPREVVAEMKVYLNEIKRTMNSLSQLNLEAATLSRLIYRTKHKLRQEKSFKDLKKINRCLTNYLTMHLPFTLASIRDTLYDDCGPTKQMLEWALVRLYGAAHLFHRIYLLCMDAAGHLFVRIKLVQIWELTFFSIATISRIWTFSQFFVRHACDWYRGLYQFLDKLELSPTSWLPIDCVLPDSLSDSLGNPDYITCKSMSKPTKMVSQLNSPLPKTQKIELTKKISSVIGIDVHEDIGVSVSRDVSKEHTSVLKDDCENTLFAKKQSSVKGDGKKTKKTMSWKNANQHSIENIKSSQDLQKFFQIESALKNASSDVKVPQHYIPIMGNVDKLQWSMIKKCIEHQIKTIKKSEQSGSTKLQEKLLKKIRINIKKWSC